MNTDWVFQEPIDFEHKQYVLLDFLQKIPGVEPFLIENAKKRIIKPK